MVPWPWPFAPVFLVVLISLGALVVFLVSKHVIRGGETSTHLPILVGFKREVLPTLAVLWAGLIIAFLVTKRDYLWTILPGPQRNTIMETQAAALGRLTSEERVSRMADMMGGYLNSRRRSGEPSWRRWHQC